MYNHKHCPNCDTHATQAVNTEYYANHIERIRVCMEDDCPTQYVVSYGLPEITETKHIE